MATEQIFEFKATGLADIIAAYARIVAAQKATADSSIRSGEAFSAKEKAVLALVKSLKELPQAKALTATVVRSQVAQEESLRKAIEQTNKAYQSRRIPAGGTQQQLSPVTDQFGKDFAKIFAKSVEEGFRNAQKGNVLSGIANVITAPLKAAGGAATGILGSIGFGLVQSITNPIGANLGKGLSTALEVGLSNSVGSSELFGEKIGGALGNAAVSAISAQTAKIPDLLQAQIDKIDDRGLRKKLKELLKIAAETPAEIGQIVQATIGQDQIQQEGLAQRSRPRVRAQRQRPAAQSQAVEEFRKAVISLNEAEAPVIQIPEEIRNQEKDRAEAFSDATKRLSDLRTRLASVTKGGGNKQIAKALEEAVAEAEKESERRLQQLNALQDALAISPSAGEDAIAAAVADKKEEIVTANTELGRLKKLLDIVNAKAATAPPPLNDSEKALREKRLQIETRPIIEAINKATEDAVQKRQELAAILTATTPVSFQAISENIIKRKNEVIETKDRIAELSGDLKLIEEDIKVVSKAERDSGIKNPELPALKKEAQVLTKEITRLSVKSQDSIKSLNELIKIYSDRQKQIQSAKDLADQTKATLDNQIAQQQEFKQPKAFVDIARSALGDQFSSDNLPSLRVSDADAKKAGAKALYSAAKNEILVTQEIFEAIQKNTLNKDQIDTLQEELFHAQDFAFGSFKGISALKQNRITTRAVTPTPEEFAALAPELGSYSPEKRQFELNAKVQARRGTQAFLSQQEQQAQLERIPDIAVNKIKIENRETDLNAALKNLEEVAAAAGEDVSGTIERISNLFSIIKANVNSSVDSVIQSGNITASDFETFNAYLKGQIEQAENLISQAKNPLSIKKFESAVAPVKDVATQNAAEINRQAELLGSVEKGPERDRLIAVLKKNKEKNDLFFKLLADELAAAPSDKLESAGNDFAQKYDVLIRNVSADLSVTALKLKELSDSVNPTISSNLPPVKKASNAFIDPANDPFADRSNFPARITRRRAQGAESANTDQIRTAIDSVSEGVRTTGAVIVRVGTAIQGPSLQLAKGLANTIVAGAKLTGTLYKAAQAAEEFAFDFIPAAKPIKRVGQIAAFGAATAAIPGLQPAIGGIAAATQGALTPLAGAANAQIAAQIAGNVPNVLGLADGIAKLAAGGVDLALVGGSALIAKAGVATIGGKSIVALGGKVGTLAINAVNSAIDNAALNLQPKQKPLALPSLERQLEPVEVQQPKVVEVLKQAKVTAEKVVSAAVEGTIDGINEAKVATQTAKARAKEKGAIEVSAVAVPEVETVKPTETAKVTTATAEKAKALGKVLDNAFAEQYAEFKKAIESGDARLIAASEQRLRSFIQNAKSDVDKVIADLKEQKAQGNPVEKAISDLGGVKGRLTQKDNLVTRNVAAFNRDQQIRGEDLSAQSLSLSDGFGAFEKGLEALDKASRRAADEIARAIAAFAEIDQKTTLGGTIKAAAQTPKVQGVAKDLAVNTAGFAASSLAANQGQLAGLAGDAIGALAARQTINTVTPFAQAYLELRKTLEFRQATNAEKIKQIRELVTKYRLDEKKQGEELFGDIVGFGVGNLAAQLPVPVPLKGAIAASAAVPQLSRLRERIQNRVGQAPDAAKGEDLQAQSLNLGEIGRQLSSRRKKLLEQLEQQIGNVIDELTIRLKGGDDLSVDNAKINRTLARLNKAAERLLDERSEVIDRISEENFQELIRANQLVLNKVQARQSRQPNVDNLIEQIDNNEAEKIIRETQQQIAATNRKLFENQRKGIADVSENLLLRVNDPAEIKAGESIAGQIKQFYGRFQADIQENLRKRLAALLTDAQTVGNDIQTSQAVFQGRSKDGGTQADRNLAARDAQKLGEVNQRLTAASNEARAILVKPRVEVDQKDLNRLKELEQEIRDVYKAVNLPPPPGGGFLGGIGETVATQGPGAGGGLLAGAVSLGAGQFAQQTLSGATRQATESFKGFAAFDQQIRTVGVVSQASGSDVAGLRAEVERLAKETTKTSSEVSATSIAMAKQGLSAKDVTKALAGVVQSSEATGESLESTGEIIVTTLNQFGLSAENSLKVADLFTQASNASGTGTVKLGESLKYVGGQAKDANQSVQETVKALALMSAGGLDASSAGTGLAEALKRMRLASASASTEFQELKSRGSKTAIEAFKQLDIQTRDSAGNLLPITTVLGRVKESLKNFKQEDKELILNALFSVQGSRAVLSVIGLTDEKIKQVSDSMDNFAGSSEKASKALKAGPQGTLETFTGSLDQANLKLGETVAIGFAPLLQGATALLNGFLALPDPIQKTLLAVGTFGTTLSAAAVALIAFNIANQSMIGGLVRGGVALAIQTSAQLANAAATGAATAATSIFTTQINLSGVGLLRQAAASGIAATAQGLFSAATSSTAIALGKLALAAGVAALAVNTTQIAFSRFESGGQVFKDTAQGVAESIREIEKRAGKTSEAITGILPKDPPPTDWIDAIVFKINEIPGAVSAAKNAIAALPIPGAKQVADLIPEKFTTNAEKRVKDLGEEFGNLSKITVGVEESAKKARQSFAEGIISKEALESEKEKLTKTIDGINNAINSDKIKPSQIGTEAADRFKKQLELERDALVKQKEALDKATAAKEANTKAGGTIKSAATVDDALTRAKDRNAEIVADEAATQISIEEIRANGTLTVEQAEVEKLKAVQARIDAEIAAESEKAQALLKLPAGKDAESEKKRQEEIQAADKRINELSIESRRNKIQQTEAIEKESIARITKAQQDAEDTIKKANDDRVTQVKRNQLAASRGGGDLAAAERNAAAEIEKIQLASADKEIQIKKETLARIKTAEAEGTINPKAAAELAKKTQQEIASATQQRIDLEIAAERRLRDERIRVIQESLQAQNNATDLAIANLRTSTERSRQAIESQTIGLTGQINELNKQKTALDQIEASYQRQTSLRASQINLQRALTNLEQVGTQIAVTNADRALQIRTQLNDGSVKSLQEQIALENELAALGFGGNELDILNQKLALENELAAQKEQARIAEQEATLRSTRLEAQQQAAAAQRGVIDAQRLLVEAKITDLKQRQAELAAQAAIEDAKLTGTKRVNEAQAAVEKARVGGNAGEIQTAETGLTIAQQERENAISTANQQLEITKQASGVAAEGIAIAQQNLVTAQQQVAVQQEISNNTLLAVEATRQAENAQANAAESARIHAQNLEFAKVQAAGLRTELEGAAAASDRIGGGARRPPGRREGGSVEAGSLYEVNEAGQEAFKSPSGLFLLGDGQRTFFRPSESGTVIPADKTTAMMKEYLSPMAGSFAMPSINVQMGTDNSGIIAELKANRREIVSLKGALAKMQAPINIENNVTTVTPIDDTIELTRRSVQLMRRR
jgi:TP901 family phage tail tape measure protein